MGFGPEEQASEYGVVERVKTADRGMEPKISEERVLFLRRNPDREVSWQSSPRRRLIPWLREYGIELELVTMVFLVLFLALEPWDVRKAVLRWLGQSIEWCAALVGNAGRRCLDWLDHLSFSEAAMLLLLAFIWCVAVWRLRFHVLRHQEFWSTHCPQCRGTGLYRIHRKWYDNLLCRIGFPVRRYLCSNCHWRGIRVYQSGGDLVTAFVTPESVKLLDSSERTWHSGNKSWPVRGR